jgi:hypothetical protein
VVVGDDPVVIDRGDLLNLVFSSIVEDGSSPWAEDSDDGIDLFFECDSDESSLVCLPDGKDAPDGKVSVHDRASVERVEGDYVAISLADLNVFRSFLTGKGFDQGVRPEVFFNDVVAVDVLEELLVSKVIGGFQLKDGGVSQEGGDFVGSVKDGLDDGLDTFSQLELEIFSWFFGAFCLLDCLHLTTNFIKLAD